MTATVSEALGQLYGVERFSGRGDYWTAATSKALGALAVAAGDILPSVG